MANDPPATTQVWVFRLIMAGAASLVAGLFTVSAMIFSSSGEQQRESFRDLQTQAAVLAQQIEREAEARRAADLQFMQSLHLLELRLTIVEKDLDETKEEEKEK